MNTIYYRHSKSGKRAAVKVGQGGMDWLEQNGQRTANGALPRSSTPRRPTPAEADARMYRAGFVRCPRRGSPS